MPIFDVMCKDCDVVEEHMVKINEEPTNCKQCKSSNVVKLLGGGSFRFKAGCGGFYATDFKRGKDKRESLDGKTRTKIYGDKE